MSADQKPSITFRADNKTHPDRKEKFLKVLAKRGANASDVLNNFVDAYIECDGDLTFPVKFVCEGEEPPKKKK